MYSLKKAYNVITGDIRVMRDMYQVTQRKIMLLAAIGYIQGIKKKRYIIGTVQYWLDSRCAHSSE